MQVRLAVNVNLRTGTSLSNGRREKTSARTAFSLRLGDVQIDQDIARLGAFVGADDSPVLEFVHDAGRPRVTEPQPALHKRHARLLFAPNHFDALLDQRRSEEHTSELQSRF